MASKRLFVAIAIPPQIRSALAAYKNNIALAGLSWVKEENLHITLLFLGDVNVEEIPLVEQRLADLAGLQPFYLQCKEIIPVTRRGKLSMIWAGFEENTQFVKLALQISATLHHPPDHSPLPHVTLARVKRGHLVKPDNNNFPLFASFGWQVQKFGLWESVLNPQGAVYRVLNEWDLEGI